MFRRRQFLILLIVLAACTPGTLAFPTYSPAPPTATFTPAPPTPTPAPLAAQVNGEGVLLADYQAELVRLQSALTELGKSMSADEQRQLVLDQLVNQALLAQAAVKAGYNLDDATLQTHIADLTTQAGGAEKLSAWMGQYGYTEESLRNTIRQGMLAAWQRDQVTQGVPTTAEQIHARQIRVRDEETANSYYAQLEAGTEFATLAIEVDPLTSGELGWFPRGYLLQPAVEEAVFLLQPGQYSKVIHTGIGYHIVFVIEREPDRPLSPEALNTLQHQAIDQWLDTSRAKSTIEILLP